MTLMELAQSGAFIIAVDEVEGAVVQVSGDYLTMWIEVVGTEGWDAAGGELEPNPRQHNCGHDGLYGAGAVDVLYAAEDWLRELV